MRCAYSFVSCYPAARLLAVPESRSLLDSLVDEIECFAFDREGEEKLVSVVRELISNDSALEVFFSAFDDGRDVTEWFDQEELEFRFDAAMRIFRNSTKAGIPCYTAPGDPGLFTKMAHGIAFCGPATSVRDGECSEYLRKTLGLS
jgi:hypothetical protein